MSSPQQLLEEELVRDVFQVLGFIPTGNNNTPNISQPLTSTTSTTSTITTGSQNPQQFIKNQYGFIPPPQFHPQMPIVSDRLIAFDQTNTIGSSASTSLNTNSRSNAALNISDIQYLQRSLFPTLVPCLAYLCETLVSRWCPFEDLATLHTSADYAAVQTQWNAVTFLAQALMRHHKPSNTKTIDNDQTLSSKSNVKPNPWSSFLPSSSSSSDGTQVPMTSEKLETEKEIVSLIPPTTDIHPFVSYSNRIDSVIGDVQKVLDSAAASQPPIAASSQSQSSSSFSSSSRSGSSRFSSKQ